MCSCRSSVTKRSLRISSSSVEQPARERVAQEERRREVLDLARRERHRPRAVEREHEAREKTRVVGVEAVRALEDRAVVRTDAERRTVKDCQRHHAPGCLSDVWRPALRASAGVRPSPKGTAWRPRRCQNRRTRSRTRCRTRCRRRRSLARPDRADPPQPGAAAPARRTADGDGMIRALTTLVGLACAAALLLLVTDTGSAEGGGLWQRAALLAGAGLVAGAFYQLGGIRRPGRAPQHAAARRRVRAVDAARRRDLRASRGHARVAQRPRARHPPGQRADALVGVVPDPRVHERPAARVRARRAARRRSTPARSRSSTDEPRRSRPAGHVAVARPARARRARQPRSTQPRPSRQRDASRVRRRGSPRRRRSRAGASSAPLAAAR